MARPPKSSTTLRGASEPKKRTRLPSSESVRTAVEADAGVAALSALVVGPAVQAGMHHVAPITFEPRPFFGLRHKERYRTKAAEALLDMIGARQR